MVSKSNNANTIVMIMTNGKNGTSDKSVATKKTVVATTNKPTTTTQPNVPKSRIPVFSAKAKATPPTLDTTPPSMNTRSKKKIEEEVVDTPKERVNDGLETLIQDVLDGEYNHPSKKRKHGVEEDDCESESDTDSDSDGEDWEYEYEEEEVDYLKRLDDEERSKILELEKSVYDSRRSDVPLRFKILQSNLSVGAKYIVLNKLDMCSTTEDDLKIRTWADGLANIPFGKFTEQSINITDGKEKIFHFLRTAHETLNDSIHGHTDAKAQILEYIAQYITNPKSQGKCLALQGPAGNGKTTLVRNGIAKVLNRPFAQISLGGANTVSSLSGHDFTYEGSQCGRICSILCETGVMNPIIYFDELDKVSSSHRGDDIYNFLCHITDFSQNSSYQDKYYDGIDLDLSRAIFIFSFNDITRINPILLDRLHVIHTNGFNTAEKTTIAKKFLIPSQMREIGIESDNIRFTDEVLHDLINSHCREEQGVRKLKRIIEGIFTKLNVLQFTSFGEYSIPLPYDMEGLSFPLEITHRILNKLVTEEKKDKSYLSMYS